MGVIKDYHRNLYSLKTTDLDVAHKFLSGIYNTLNPASKLDTDVSLVMENLHPDIKSFRPGRNLGSDSLLAGLCVALWDLIGPALLDTGRWWWREKCLSLREGMIEILYKRKWER